MHQGVTPEIENDLDTQIATFGSFATGKSVLINNHLSRGSHDYPSPEHRGS
jgi:hypothetical protein